MPIRLTGISQISMNAAASALMSACLKRSGLPSSLTTLIPIASLPSVLPRLSVSNVAG